MSTSYAHLAGVYDEIVVDPCPSQWAQFIDRTWADDHVTRVLDVCCGTGLMTVELLARGLDVVGLDASPEMLSRARELLGPDVPLLEVVLPDLPVDGPFDAAVSTLDGLNYLTLPDFARTMTALAGVLRPGGWLVFDVHAEATLDFAEANPVLEGADGGRDFTLITVVDRAARACATTITLSSADGGFVETHVQYVHSEQQIRSALLAAGFDSIAVTDEYTDEPVDIATTLRATWVCRRASG